MFSLEGACGTPAGSCQEAGKDGFEMMDSSGTAWAVCGRRRRAGLKNTFLNPFFCHLLQQTIAQTFLLKGHIHEIPEKVHRKVDRHCGIGGLASTYTCATLADHESRLLHF